MKLTDLFKFIHFGRQRVFYQIQCFNFIETLIPTTQNKTTLCYLQIGWYSASI